jgi:arylsulfatase A-like enzyme
MIPQAAGVWRPRRAAFVLALAVAVTVQLGPSRPTRASAARNRPNVLLIVTDDQRKGTMSALPVTRRWFKRGGVTYTNAWAPTPLCCPARATIMTGRYAHNHGVRSNEEGQVDNLDHKTTLQYLLGGAGYRTGIFGKFLNGWNYSLVPPYFDDFALSWSYRYYGAPWNINGTQRVVRTYATDFLSARVAHFLRDTEANDSRPWFAYVATRAPHSPSTPEQGYRFAPVRPWSGNPAVFEQDRTDKPPHVQAEHAGFLRAARVRKRQLRSLMSVDDLVGRVFRTLKRMEERRSTLAVFVSDNGVQWAEHGIGGKGSAYTGSIKIPMYARWPGHLVSRARDGRITTQVDIAPTILDAAGVSPRHVLDGRSLLDSSWDRDLLFNEYWYQPRRSTRPSWASVRSGSRQYIEYYDPGATTLEFREYYDLRADPWQLLNLFGDDDPRNDPGVARLAALLDRFRSCAGSSCP